MNTTGLRKHFDRIAASFDGIYTGEKSTIGRLWDRQTRSNIPERLKRTLLALEPVTGKRILDVGCGPGRYVVALASRGAKQVVGLDISERMIELAKSLAARSGLSSQCQFFPQDILEYTDTESYDAVIAQGFFDYTPEPQAVFDRLRYFCRGTLVASFPWRYAFRVVPRKLWLASRGCKVRFYSRTQILSLCRNSGFSCKLLERRGPIFVLIAVAGDRQDS